MSARTTYRLALAAGLGTTLVLLYGIGALGIIGPGGPPDLMYVAALAVGLVGAALARFRAPGMAIALFAAAAATVAAGVVAIVAGLHHTEGASVLEILGLTGMFAALFALSGWLFRQAVGRSASVAVRSRRE